MSKLQLALILFVLTYVLMISIPKYRAHIAVTSAILTVLFGFIRFEDVLSNIDFNVIMMIAGTMGIVSLFIESKMPSLMADYIIDKAPNVKVVIVALSIFAGLVSAFIDNVATVLMVAPVAINIAKKLKLSPVNMIIAISIASNLQGAATLVGDTTSILLGSYANMNFLDFIFYKGRPGLFWIVQLSMIASSIFLLFIFRKMNDSVEMKEKTVVSDYFPSILLSLTILFLIIGSLVNIPEISFLPNTKSNFAGYTCIIMLIIGVLVQGIRFKNKNIIIDVIKEIDFFTLFLLMGLFIVIAGIREVGVIDEIAKIFIKVGNDNVFVLYTILTFASVIFSAFIDNIPYVATMLPVVTTIATSLGIDPTLLFFGLLSGATLGGNLTPIGASANIASLGILRKENYEVKTSDFMKISVPYTLIAVFSGYVLIWLLFS